MKFVFLSATLLCGGLCPLSAATIFTGGGSASLPFWDVYSIGTGPGNGYMAHWFELSSTATLAAFTYEGGSGSSNTFTVGVFADSGGVGSLLASGTASLFGSESFTSNASATNYLVNLDNEINLAAGTYWLVFEAVDENARLELIGSTSAPGETIVGGMAVSDTFEGPYLSNGMFLNFTLQDTKFVPEPSVVLLAASGMLGLLRRRRCHN